MMFFFQAEDGIRDVAVTGVQTCALPISKSILHLQEILVVTQDSGAGNLLRSSVGSQQIEAVADLLGLDHLGPAAPLQLTVRSEEHTSELQSRLHLVCRLLLEKKKEKQAARLE